MAYKDLRKFITRLEREGELRRIAAPVDVDLEITEITDRVSKGGGPALYFERPRSARDGRSYAVPLLINTLGSKKRLELALEVSSIEDVARRIEGLLEMKPPEGLIDKVRLLPKLAELGSFFPKAVKDGPVKEVVERDNLSLAQFPIMKCWPQDAGRFITFPMVITRSPRTGRRNVGCYRLQVYDERTTAMHWQVRKGGAEHFRWLSRQGRGKRMDVAAALGSDPVTMLSAILPLPEDLDEFLFAGFLRQEPVELVKCETVDLEVPANAEIVLEGYVDLGDIRTEGPFGDHTGYYSLEDRFPAFHLTTFTKCIVVVDNDVDVHNLREVVWKAFNHIDPERDIQFVLGPVDQLEHASRLPNFGSKMGVDSTRKWPSEGFARPWPDEIVMDEETKRKVDAMWESLGLA